jgi:hypothetical protein
MLVVFTDYIITARFLLLLSFLLCLELFLCCSIYRIYSTFILFLTLQMNVNPKARYRQVVWMPMLRHPSAGYVATCFIYARRLDNGKSKLILGAHTDVLDSGNKDRLGLPV